MSDHPLFVIHTIRAGNQYQNDIPVPPEGRKVQRVWSLMDADKLAVMGPVHNQSAFLEDRIHDYLIINDKIQFYSRLVPTHDEVQVVFDYETTPEREARMSKMVKANDAKRSAAPR